MKEIVIVSGKGGTGKTSITASFAALARHSVIADCDVDAANLHLILAPEILSAHDFVAGVTAKLDPATCTGCGICEADCRFDAILPPEKPADSPAYRIDPIACEGCAVCAYVCPEKAIRMETDLCGSWFRSKTRYGPMLHAELLPAQENSGRLVSVLRREARQTAEENGAEVILVDGPPGVGCPVIASLTGADYAVLVSEPTVSGLEDLKRVAKLAAHFGIRAGVVVNKADINPELAGRIRGFASTAGLDVLGQAPYDISVTRAQAAAKTLIEAGSATVAAAIERIWRRLWAVVQGPEAASVPFVLIS